MRTAGPNVAVYLVQARPERFACPGRAIVRRGTRYYATTERLHVIASNIENSARVVIDAGAKLSKMVT